MRVRPRDIYVRLPSLGQCYDHDCGPAVVASLCSYFGVPEPRVTASPTYGTQAAELIAALESAGLTVHGSTGTDLAELCDTVSAGVPVICNVRAYGNVGHWVVVCGFNTRRIFAADPMLPGMLGTLTRGDFVARWGDEDGERLGLAVTRRREPRTLRAMEIAA